MEATMLGELNFDPKGFMKMLLSSTNTEVARTQSGGPGMSHGIIFLSESHFRNKCVWQMLPGPLNGSS